MGITLRKIEESDLEQIMRWRMDPDITRYMNTDPQLTLEGQKEWLRGIRSRQDVKYWLIEADGRPAGVINTGGLEALDGSCTWGYYVGEKGLRSIKTALSLEMSLYDYVFEKLGRKTLYGDIFTLNQGVIQLHLLCGSKIVEEKKAHVCKNGRYYDVTFMSMEAERWQELKKTKKYEKIEFPD